MVKDATKVEKGRRFDYGVFTGVEFRGIEDGEVIFEDKHCNIRAISVKDFETSASLRPISADLHPVKVVEEPSEATKKEKKEDAMKNEKLPVKDKVSAKAVKGKVPEKAKSISVDKKASGEAPIPGWITVEAAAKKFNKSEMVIRHHVMVSNKIEAKYFTVDGKSKRFVLESSVAKLYTKTGK